MFPPLGPSVTYARGGRTVRVKIPQPGRPGPGGRRREISCYSAKSRNNFLDQVNAVDQARAPAPQWCFWTPTYHLKHPDPRGAKRHLDTWTKRLRREWPMVAGWWKLEPQRRRAPHFHLLLWLNGADHDQFAWWAGRAWNEIVDPGNVQHLAVQVHQDTCQRLRDWSGVTTYAAKYMGKLVDGEGWESPGRWWGVINRAALPVELVTEDVTPGEAVVVRRQLRRLAAHQTTGRYRREDPDAEPSSRLWHRRIKRERLTAAAVKMLRDCGYIIRPYHYRRRARGTGGIRGYARTDTILRLLAWARSQPPRPPPRPADIPPGTIVTQSGSWAMLAGM